MAPIKGFNRLFTDLWHQRVANGTEAEQAALRGLHTMVSAAVQGRGTNGFSSQSPDGHRYELEAVGPDDAGAQIRFGRPDQAPSVHTTDNLLTRAGQILFNESLSLGEEGTFNPRESLVTGLGTETLRAHRASTASKTELAERVQTALQESIDSPGAVSESISDLTAGEPLQWQTAEVGETPILREERLEDLVTGQGRDVLMGQTAPDASPQGPVSDTATETESGLEPDDLVTEHFRRFQDAAHSEASAMAEIEELIVSAAFGQDVDWQNSSHIHGQGPDMTVSFQTGVNEAGETTFASLKVVDLVDESVAEHLGIAEPTTTDASGVETETEDTAELDTTVDNATEVESAAPSATEAGIDVQSLFTPEFTELQERVTSGQATLNEGRSIEMFERMVASAAAGHGVSAVDGAWDSDGSQGFDRAPFVDAETGRPGMGIAYLELDENEAHDLSSADLLTPEGQAILSASIEAGPDNTFDVTQAAAGATNATDEAIGQETVTDAETATPANSVDVSTMFTEDFSTTKDDAVAHGSGGAMYRSAVQDLEDLVKTAASGQGVNLEESEPWTAEEEPEPFGISHHDLRSEGAGVQMQYWQIDGADGWVDSTEMLTKEGQAVLSAALDAGEGETFNPQMILRGVELETKGWGTGEQPTFDAPSLEGVLGTDSSQLSEGPIGRWTQAEHESQSETPPAVGAGAHEME